MSTDTNTGTKTKGRSAVRQQGDQLTAGKETVMSADNRRLVPLYPDGVGVH